MKKSVRIGDLRGLKDFCPRDHWCLDHLHFPSATPDQIPVINKLFFQERFTYREICYVLNINLYSCYVAIHPDHPKKIRECRDFKRGKVKSSCREVMQLNPEITDYELRFICGFSQSSIANNRLKLNIRKDTLEQTEGNNMSVDSAHTRRIAEALESIADLLKKIVEYLDKKKKQGGKSNGM